MDIAPYRFIKIDDTTNAFVLNEGRKRFNRLYRVFLPSLLLLVSLTYLFLFDKSDSPSWINWFPLLMGIIGILILTTKYPVELRFNSSEIKLIKRNAFWRSSVLFPVNAQRHVAAETIATKGEGSYLYVINQQFNKITLLSILYPDMNQEKIAFMLKLLSEKTGLSIM